VSDYGGAVKIDAKPELDPEVERALRDVVADASADRSGYSAPWRRAALTEGVDREESADEPVRYAFSPRRTRGATRA
jgi:hypothetical protein